MADTTRRIVLDLLARNRAKGELASFGRGLDNIYRNARRMAVGLLAAAGIGGIGYLIKQQMAVIDSTAKLSDRLGITTEALIGLQHGAKISGVEQATLNKSLEIFSRRLGEVTMGTGEAKRALEEMGLSADDIIGLNMDEAISVIADKINKLQTQSQKAAVANYLFGRSGQQLLNMFDKGSAGIAEMRREAERLGLTFSRLDAAQVEAANDALARSRAVLTGLFRQVTIELSPYIETLADKFTELATSGEGVGSNVVNVFEDMSLAAIRFGSQVQTIPAYWKGVQASAHETLAVIYGLADAATNLDVLFKKLNRPGWEKSYKELAEEQRQIAASLLAAGGRQLAGTYGQENAVRQFYEGLRRTAAARAGATGGGAAAGGMTPEAKLGASLAEQQSAMAEHYDKMIQAGGNYQEMTERMAVQGWQTEVDAIAMRMEEEAEAREKSAQDEKDVLSARADAYRDIYGQMGKMTKSAYDAQRQALAGLYEDYKKTGVAAEDLDVWQKEKLRVLSIEYMKTSGDMAEGFTAAGMTIRHEIDSWGDKAYRFSMTFRDSIAGGLENSMRDFDNWKDHLLNVLEEVYWSAVRIAFIEPAARGLASGMTAGMSAMFNAGGTPTNPAGATMAKYQHGGIADYPHRAIVGEVPEAIVPLSGGRSIPVEMRGGGGGGAQTMEIRIINQGGQTLKISSAEEYMLSDRRITEVVIRESETNPKLRRSIKQASR